jgi:hypothetical protein
LDLTGWKESGDGKRKLFIEKLLNLYCSPSTISVLNSREMDGLLAHIDELRQISR